jgi:hypothetical protein
LAKKQIEEMLQEQNSQRLLAFSLRSIAAIKNAEYFFLLFKIEKIFGNNNLSMVKVWCSPPNTKDDSFSIRILLLI